jgi:hypothetical protein
VFTKSRLTTKKSGPEQPITITGVAKSREALMFLEKLEDVPD